MNVRSLVVALAVTVVGAVVLTGCIDDGTERGQDLSADEVSGRVVTTDGRPVVGATILVNSLEYVGEVLATTGADGTYRVRLASEFAASNVEVSGRLETEYNQALWRMPLEPQDPTTGWGEDGLALDFVLRTHGEGFWTLYDPGHWSRYFGFAVTIELYDENSGDGFDQAMELPAGATIDVTFTPTGPLIDGATIEPFVRSLTLETAAGRSNIRAGTIKDVPIGTYTVTAAVTSPTSTPLRVGSSCDSTTPSQCPFPNDPLSSSTTLRVFPKAGHSAPYQNHPAAQVLLHILP